MNISENYRLVFDEYNVTLQFFEQKIKTKKDGTKEPYEYQENSYHKTVKQALNAFLQKSLISSKSVEEILQRIAEVENKIQQMPQNIEA